MAKKAFAVNILRRVIDTVRERLSKIKASFSVLRKLFGNAFSNASSLHKFPSCLGSLQPLQAIKFQGPQRN